MTQLILVLSFALISFGVSFAQDLPPLPDASASSTAGTLPPLPDANASSNAATLPPLPDASASSTAGTMPALPDANASSNAAALPPLPGANASSTAGTMPPLPSSNNASAAPAAGVTAEPSANSQASTNWSSPSLSVPPSGPASAPKVPGVPQAKVAKPHKMTPAEKYRYDHTRPNVIYGGWVWPKGGEVDDRLAWTSQEILNALVPHGFNVSKEEGNYDGEDTTTPQWRQWTFSIDHSNVVTQVYIRPVKQRIWVRVGPSEAPADMTLAQVEAIRKQDLRMLKLLRRQLGKRFTPHHRGDWSAPYNYKRATADE